ncbi:MAG: ERCC4 domain-containing protein [Planctomycetes bacterium]|nr:ERCC4 domain-containing protein [Planctomycetota bacterium]
MKLPATISPENVVAICDSREQLPLDLAPRAVEIGTLPTGDYSVKGLEHVVAIERKSLGDLLSCIGTEHDRFEKQVMRLLAYDVRCLAIESSWSELERGEWRSKVQPAAAIGSLLSWQARGLPLMLCDNHERAGRYVSRLLFISARRKYREARGLLTEATDRQGVTA